MTLAGWGILLFIILVAQLVHISLKTSRGVTVEGYTSAIGKYPLLTTSLAYSAAIASGITFMGVPGYAYSFGYPGLWYVCYGGVGVIVLSIAAYKFRIISTRIGAVSVVDFLGLRFGSEILRVLGVIATIMNFTFIAGQYVAMAWVFSTLWGISYNAGVLIGLLITIGYVFAGGSMATALAGRTKAAIMVIVAIIIFFTSYLFLFPGGVIELNASLYAQDPMLTWDNFFYKGSVYENPVLILLMISCLGFYYFNPNTGKYTLTLQNPKDIKKFVLIAFLFIMLMGLAAWGGLGARAYLGPGHKPDQALVLLFSQVFHPFLAALLMIGILCAIWSSCDDTLVVTGTAVANDLYRRVFAFGKKGQSEAMDIDIARIDRNTILINRLAVLVFGILAALLALTKPVFLVELIWTGLGATMGAVCPVIVISTVWKRTTTTGAIAGILGGWITHFTLFLGYGWNPLHSTGIGLVVALAACIIGSFLTSPPRDEEIKKIFGELS